MNDKATAAGARAWSTDTAFALENVLLMPIAAHGAQSSPPTSRTAARITCQQPYQIAYSTRSQPQRAAFEPLSNRNGQPNRQRRSLRKSIATTFFSRCCKMIDSIVNALEHAAEFRGRKASQYPDKRNIKAQASLKILATRATESGDDFLQKLRPYFDSPGWQAAVSLAVGEVGFKNHSRSLPFFISRLVRHLSQIGDSTRTA